MSTAPAPSDPAAGATKALLLDLAPVDLANRAVGREQIAKINAHRGDMALLDFILWHSADFRQGVALWEVRGDEFWVPGHFPSRPMLPGVLQVEAAAQLSAYLYNSRYPVPKLAAFTHIHHCSFRSSVVPGDDFLLLAQETKSSPRRFVTEVQGVVNGRVVFEAGISGMAIG